MLPFLDHDALIEKSKKVMKFTWLKRFYNGLSAWRSSSRRQFLQVLGRLEQGPFGLKE